MDAEAKIESAVRDAGPAGLHKSKLALLGEITEVQKAVQSLLSSRRIELTRSKAGEVVFIVNLSSGGLNESAALVLDAVKFSGTDGIEASTIVSRTKLLKTEVTKTLKQLIDRQIITETRSFTNKAKKMYLVAGVLPSTSVTGGTFYTSSGYEREVDFPFVEVVRSSALEFVQERGAVSAMQVKSFLDSLQLPKSLSVRETELMMRTLELDGDVIATRTGGQQPHFTVVRGRSLISRSSVGSTVSVSTQFPCTTCPQLERCSLGGTGAVSTRTCTYLSDWLKLE